MVENRIKMLRRMCSAEHFLLMLCLILPSINDIIAQRTTIPISKRYAVFDEKLNENEGADGPKLVSFVATRSVLGYNSMEQARFDDISKLFYITDIRLGKQTTGRSLYEELWRYPEWEAGIANVALFNDTLFGQPKAIFAALHVPILPNLPRRSWNFGYHFSGGPAFNFRPGGERVGNPVNNLIATNLNLYIDVGVWSKWRLATSLAMKLTANLIHFSNGAIQQPNRGMNMVGLGVQLQHSLGRPPPDFIRRDSIPAWQKRHGFSVFQAVGVKQLVPDSDRYLNTTTSIAYRWWSGYRSQWIAQLDLFYDQAHNSGETTRAIVPVADRENPANLYTWGFFVGHQAVYNRWGFVSGLGVYLFRRYPFTRPFYQRFGLRYRLWRGLELGIGLKAQSFGANYIEWSLGYSVF